MAEVQWCPVCREMRRFVADRSPVDWFLGFVTLGGWFLRLPYRCVVCGTPSPDHRDATA